MNDGYYFKKPLLSYSLNFFHPVFIICKPVKGKPKEQIDISKLPKGLYTIQVVEKEGTQVFRFLKE